MKESKYLNAFRTVAETGKDTFQLIGDCLLVEVIQDEEFKTKSGLILSAGTQNQVNSIHADKPTFVRILLVGEGYYNNSDDGKIEEVPLESKPGDIILVGKTSIKHFSVFGGLVTSGQTGQIGLVRESEIQMRFRGQDAFNKFFEIINSSIETKV